MARLAARIAGRTGARTDALDQGLARDLHGDLVRGELFYLPRLFVYHASTTDSAGIERFGVMESRLFVIMTIGAV